MVRVKSLKSIKSIKSLCITEWTNRLYRLKGLNRLKGLCNTSTGRFIAILKYEQNFNCHVVATSRD